MKRIMLLVAVVALMAAIMVASALPALAAHRAPPEVCVKLAVKSVEIGFMLPAVQKTCQ